MKKVNLFIGHGKASNDTVYDAGATGNGYEEHKLANELGEMVLKELKGKVDVKKIIEGNFADGKAGYSNSPCDLGLTFHFNAFNGSGNGTEILKDKKTDEVGDGLRNKYLNAITKYGFFNRGIKDYTDKLYNLKNGGDIYFEICFIDNKKDIETYQKNKAKIAKAISDISLDYLGVRSETIRYYVKSDQFKWPINDKGTIYSTVSLLDKNYFASLTDFEKDIPEGKIRKGDIVASRNLSGKISEKMKKRCRL